MFEHLCLYLHRALDQAGSLYYLNIYVFFPYEHVILLELIKTGHHELEMKIKIGVQAF